MKAVMLKGVNDLVVEDVPTPKISSDDEVLIKIDVCGICGTDLHMWAGTNYEGTFPFIPGHEWSGTVVEIGKGVKKIQIGDRVIGEPFISCRKCDICHNIGLPPYCLNIKYYGFTPETPGGMAEYHCSPEERLFKIPDKISDEEAALVDPISCSYYAIWGRAGGVAPHDNIGVFGAGPIGISAMLIGMIAGAQVVLIEPQAFRQKMARDMGAEIIIDPYKQDTVKEVLDLTNGLGLSKIIECSGSPDAIKTAIDVLAVAGVINLIGHSIGEQIPMEIGKIAWKHGTIVAAAGSPFYYPHTVTLLSRGLTDFNKLVTHRFPIDDALEAFTIGNEGSESGKIMIYPDASKIPKK